MFDDSFAPTDTPTVARCLREAGFVVDEPTDQKDLSELTEDERAAVLARWEANGISVDPDKWANSEDPYYGALSFAPNYFLNVFADYDRLGLAYCLAKEYPNAEPGSKRFEEGRQVGVARTFVALLQMISEDRKKHPD